MSDRLTISRGNPPLNQPFQILVLSGGGYRGLFTASVLERLESQTGRPMREAFDLIAGTSIGGIIACGLACGIEATEIRQAIQTNGTQIFKKQGIACIPGAQIFANLYSQTGLRNTIRKVLSTFAETPIANVEAPLLVVAVSSGDANPVVFESEGANPPERCETQLLDVALSTSAAPTYFPAHRVGLRNMIDGGLVANSPDTIALMRALGRFRRRPDQVRMVSIGTAAEKLADVNLPARGYGVFGWFLSRRLFSVTARAQERMSIQFAREILGDRYIRIDEEPSARERAVIGLDVANEQATKTLLQMADRASPQLSVSSLLNAILTQRATWAVHADRTRSS